MNLELAGKFFNFIEEKAGVEKPYVISLKLGEEIPMEINSDVEINFHHLNYDERIVVKDGTVFNKDLSIVNARYYNESFTLPKNLTVNGTFSLYNYSHELPTNLVVGKEIHFAHSTFRYIPTLDFKGSAMIYNCPNLRNIGDYFTCDFLHITDCANLQQLADDMNVRISLTVKKTPITYLGENIKPIPFITLDETEIEDLPSDLRVSNELLIKNSPILKRYTLSQIKQKLPYVNQIIGKFLP